MNFEVHFTDGTVENFHNIIEAKPNKEDEPRMMWLKGYKVEYLLNMDHVKYILKDD